MNPYGDYGRPIALFEAWKEWADLQEADTKADFPSYLFGPVRQALWQGYSRVEPQYDKYVRIENAPDFRERRLRGLNALRGIGYVGDHGEYPQMRRTERPPAALVVDTYGGEYAITRQAVINDDTGDLLNRNPQDMGYAAGIFVAESVAALIESNPTAPDGAAFYSAGRGNEVTVAFSEDSLADAITWMEGQVDDDGYRIRIQARWLTAKSARQEAIAKRALTSETSAAVASYTGAAGAGTNIMDKGTKNPVYGILPPDAVIRERFFADPNDLYLFADPAEVPAFAAGFLNGRREPFVGLLDPMVRNAMGAGMDPYTFEWDTIDFKVRHDFGVAGCDPRGTFRWRIP